MKGYWLVLILILLAGFVSSTEIVLDRNEPLRITINVLNGSGLWNQTGGDLYPENAALNLKVQTLAGTGTRCVQTSSTGVLSATSSSCGTGGGSDASAYNRANNLTTDLLLGTLKGNFTNVTVAFLSLHYKNISGIPTCSGSDKLTFDGSTLSCAADQNSAALGITNNSDAILDELNVTSINGTDIALFNKSISLVDYVLSTDTSTWQKNFQLANISNDTLRVSGNASISLWNISHSLYIFPRSSLFLTRIGNINFSNAHHFSNDTFMVLGSSAFYGSLNATTFNASLIKQAGNQVQTVNAVYNSVNFTSNYDGRADRFQNANWTSLLDTYSAAFFRIANFTSAYDARTDRWVLSNLTEALKVNANLQNALSNGTDANFGNITITKVNNSIGGVQFIEFNSSCSGFRKNSTAGLILSCG